MAAAETRHKNKKMKPLRIKFLALSVFPFINRLFVISYINTFLYLIPQN